MTSVARRACAHNPVTPPSRRAMRLVPRSACPAPPAYPARPDEREFRLPSGRVVRVPAVIHGAHCAEASRRVPAPDVGNVHLFALALASVVARVDGKRLSFDDACAMPFDDALALIGGLDA